MGLLNAVGRALGRRAALKDMKASPFREACSLAISQKLADTKLRDHWSADAVERIAGWLWQECLGIEAHENPRARCRYLLVDQTLARSRFEVLIMEPASDKNVTGFVGTQGITGKLHAHIDEIFRADEELRDLTGLPLREVDWQAANDAAVIMMWKTYWISSVFNVARVALHDNAADDERDWYKPFFHSACVASEHFTRQKAGMPSAIGDDADGMVALAYHSFMEFTLSEAPSPLKAWRDHYRDWIDAGRLKPPFGAD
ncbi:hypothetical protein [Sphingomonas beigongshangi]|uniref:hypothetical protein n=1 Tax=Sphingomonas beigongshangi TaxID=2782540 RepID=UPI001AEE8D42|nr:hypothetical protein [Sphingomonas beigongshangi]